MLSSALSSTFYAEWCARQSENSKRTPLWEREERFFNCGREDRKSGKTSLISRIFGEK